MKKDLEQSLRHMQTHPTTGTPHNQQVISAQVETIFAIDRLESEMVRLRKSINESDKQSARLEVSNYRLQWAMFILTAVGIVLASWSAIAYLLGGITSWATGLKGYASEFARFIQPFIQNIALLISLVLGPLSFFIQRREVDRYSKEIQDSIRVKDSLMATMKDSSGKIKEVR